jgi:hypothetical protein
MHRTLQLIPSYKSQLNPAFLKWYAATFHQALNIYVHWSAGGYDTPYDDYHYCIRGSGAWETTFRGNPFDSIKAHTYCRNHGAVGVGVLCMAGATSENYGACPPTRAQLEALVDLCARIVENYRIPIGNILTHAEAGDNVDYSSANDPEAPHDPYGPAHGCVRWDFFCWIDPRTWHLSTAKAAGEHVGEPPHGLLYFPDWLRGEVALRLQEDGRRHWDAALGHGL